jgi:23S rRNA pseudoU1915 N3-methylase RlmH
MKESLSEALNFFGVQRAQSSVEGKQMIAADKKRARSKRRGKRDHKAISAKLKTAAEVLLRQEGKSVIDQLAEKCRDGEVQSARLLLEMANGSEGIEDDFRSLAFGIGKE